MKHILEQLLERLVPPLQIDITTDDYFVTLTAVKRLKYRERKIGDE